MLERKGLRLEARRFMRSLFFQSRGKMRTPGSKEDQWQLRDDSLEEMLQGRIYRAKSKIKWSYEVNQKKSSPPVCSKIL